jgi:inosine-uridine nucleoside N-ribohydrolase
MKVKLVPLDVVRKVYWSKKQVSDIPETGKVNKWIKKMLTVWFDKYNHDKEKNFTLFDPLAVYLSFFPKEACWIRSGIKVITKGKQRGRTVFHHLNPPCQIATGLIQPSKITEKIFRLIFN